MFTIHSFIKLRGTNCGILRKTNSRWNSRVRGTYFRVLIILKDKLILFFCKDERRSRKKSFPLVQVITKLFFSSFLVNLPFRPEKWEYPSNPLLNVLLDLNIVLSHRFVMFLLKGKLYNFILKVDLTWSRFFFKNISSYLLQWRSKINCNYCHESWLMNMDELDLLVKN